MSTVDGAKAVRLPREQRRVPSGARLGRTDERFVIHMDNAEALSITRTPLEVVHEAPNEIAPQVDALTRGLVDRRFGFGNRLNTVARALGYLRREQEADGSWFGRWGTNYIYGTWQVLRGLRTIGEDMRLPYIRRAVAWLKLHRPAQFALTPGKVAQLMKHKSQKAAHRRTVLPGGDGLPQHLARFQAAALIHQETGKA